MVTGSSNDGAVTFSIASQSPDGVFTIGATDGVLSIADEDLLATLGGSDVTLTINVTKGDTVETASVTITIGQAVFDPSVQVTVVFTTNSPFPTREAVGEIADGGLFIIKGIDPLFYLTDGDPDFNCFDETSVVLKFTPTSRTTGTVEIENQTYECDDGLVIDVEGTDTYDTETGTYDETTETITVDYILDDGEETFEAELVITADF